MARPKELSAEQDLLWLPSHLLSDDFFLEEPRARRVVTAAFPFGAREEEYCVPPLPRQMARAWPVSTKGSPNSPCLVSSPSSRFPEQNRDDLLREAAAQLVRLRMLHEAERFRDLCEYRRLAAPEMKSFHHPPLPRASHDADGGYSASPVLPPQQPMPAAQLHYLKQQRFAALEAQVKGRGSHTPGLSPQPVRPGNGMKALFLNNPGTKRASTGTGVFLPRTPGSKPEPRSTPACSTVLVPARVAHALNLTLEELGSQPRFADGFPFDENARSNAMLSYQELKSELGQPAPVVTREIQLPQEWTY
ncbi:hypothetical protein Cni_G29161 [Canna indica]|uniref:Uncharacterized protein n=1 Tax=Canna indica TaxID=4628 RepID=A0AAQ3QSZ4_9LILI|nr:hypothetical protein Cni_G29161 [Canna indica]